MKRKKIVVSTAVLIIMFSLTFMSAANAIKIEKKADDISLKTAETSQLDDYTNITVHEAWDLLNDTSNGIQLPIDVRTDPEWEAGFIDTPFPESPIHYHLDRIKDPVGLQEFIDLYDGEDIIIYCAKGGRSFVATKIIMNTSFSGEIYNMVGGTTEWVAQGLPMRTNDPPEAPDIQGPTQGKKKTFYDYVLESEDPDMDGVRFFVDWGDGTNELTDYTESGIPIVANHAWEKDGTYTITCRTVDYYGAESENTTLDVTIPKTKLFEFNFYQFMNSRLTLLLKYLFS
jgi:rhodanese-related sulfurtransferase